MFGNLINKNQLIELVREGLVSITPFNEELMQIVHYPLKTGELSVLDEDGERKQTHDCNKSGKPGSIGPNQYVIVETAEFIKMPTEGIVGQFIPSSKLITKGLGLVCGKISAPYGMKGERTIFGLKNLTDREIQILPDEVIAYVQFFDLRGLRNDEFLPTPKDLAEWVKRRKMAADDGVSYR